MDARQLLLLVSQLLLWVVFFPLLAAIANNELATNNPPGFISIDCGVEQDYVDKETGISYKSDKDFISTGENHNIYPDYDEEDRSLGRVLLNVRSFPKGQKNCYSLRSQQGKDHNYLVRAYFKYGNYDGKNQLSFMFHLHLGVNMWGMVEPADASEPLLFEIVHFSLTDTIYVCLVNTGDGTPFISALELRPLNDSIYRINSAALVNNKRYDLGKSTNMSVRYKDDVYDRIWDTQSLVDWISVTATSDSKVDGSSNSYKLPVEVLRTAVQPPSTRRSLDYKISIDDQQSYICFHFAEILEIPQGQRREFTITLNGVFYGLITPQYLKPSSICTGKPIQGDVQFSIISTEGSDFPPILNALEIYTVKALPNSPTDQADFHAIMAIKQTYNIDRDYNWQADPCMPKEFAWIGLNCSYDTNPPRIISLNLSSSKLIGKISPSFSNLKAIESLDLSYNELSGAVPEFLAQLPNLKFLNLTGNKLTGLVPQSLVQKSSNGELQLRLEGNPNLCVTGPCKKGKKSFLLPVVISVVTVSVLLLFISVMIFWRVERKKARAQSKMQGSVISKNRSFSYLDIVIITDNFKTIIGEGGFGKVYFGTLNENTQVAVKLLSQHSRQSHKEFQTEAELLMIVNHKNLVSLIGYCDDRDNKALIYEYMVNGNLKEHLSETSESILNWDERLHIAVDAAQGLEYLHNGCKPPIIHRDLKTANILLNEKFQAKIADFGLSRAFENESGSHITTRPAGTYGYLDPEAQASGTFTKKSDVYSFGIILLELITGQPAIKRDMSGNIISVQQRVGKIIKKGDIQSIADPRLLGQFDSNSAWKAVEIALTCVRNVAAKRPDICDVLTELKECLPVEEGRTGLSNSFQTRPLYNDAEMAPTPR